MDILLFCVTSAAFVLHQQQHRQQSLSRRPASSSSLLDANEHVCTVDEHNVPTPQGNLRSEMRSQNLWHRATYIIIRHEPHPADDADDDDDDNEKKDTILVQKRSDLKDYRPGKLDPAPGGVVGFQESYELNATREIMEEMNIDVTENNNNKNEMKKLFVFPYEDEKVKCWGALFEVIYRGPLSSIRMQPEEVSDVLRLSFQEIREMSTKESSSIWTPDGLYALQLYQQFHHDRSLNRRLLQGTSTGDLERYRKRPRPQVIFFDCDDCLYFDGWQLAQKLTAKIEDWCTSRKNLPQGEAYQLYQRHGTALKGLLAEGHIINRDEQQDDDNNDNDTNEIDEYLRDVHDLPIHEHLSIDHELRSLLLQIDPTIPKYVFTASVRHHAERCLKALGIEDLFVDIIDVKSCSLETKHAPSSFEAAMRVANVTEPEACVFLDDSRTNIAAARRIGWRAYLVGRVGRDCGQPISSEHAEQELDRIHDLKLALPPELFVPSSSLSSQEE